MTTGVVSTSTARCVERVEAVGRAPHEGATSTTRYCGVTMPRLSRSMSRRSFRSRSSLRAFVDSRSRRSSRSSSSSSRCRSNVRDSPRIEVSGLRSSCETAARNVFFISSSDRRRSAASRSRPSLSRSASSASLRSVMSNHTPWTYDGRPSSSCEERASSRTHTVRPSRATNPVLARPLALLLQEREVLPPTASRSSGWIESPATSPTSRAHSSA